MKETLFPLIRHALTVAAGWFIGKGYFDEATSNQLIAGALAAIGVLWSLFEKRGNGGGGTPVALVALSALIVGSVGCTNLQQNQALNITAEIVAKDATYFALKDNPDLRGDFERALVELNAIAIADSIKFDDVVALVLRLPVEQLKSADAQIIASDVAIIVKGFAPNQGEIISPEKLDRIRDFVKALRDGVKRGLSQTQVQ